MEPSNMSHWSDARFVMQVEITFSLYKGRKPEVPVSDMLAAVVLADRENPWWDRSQTARLNVLGPDPKRVAEDDRIVVYSLSFQSGCPLVPSQLPAYVKYAAQLAETAHRFITNREAVCWIGSSVSFQGASVIFNAKRRARV